MTSNTFTPSLEEMTKRRDKLRKKMAELDLQAAKQILNLQALECIRQEQGYIRPLLMALEAGVAEAEAVKFTGVS
jgi:hypothetical protein